MAGAVWRPGRLWPSLLFLLSPVAVVGSVSTSAVAQCVGPISSTTPNDSIVNSACITINSDFISAIFSSGVGTNLNNSGSITTTGEESNGIYSNGSGVNIINSGDITTSGGEGRGIRSDGASASISNSGTISAAGADAQGIFSIGLNATISNSGSIATSGDNGSGILSSGGNAAVTNSGTIATTGGAAHGIRSSGSGAVISNTGAITTSGVNAQGIRSMGDDAQIDNSGTITTSGDRSQQNPNWSSRGIWASGARVSIVNSGTITTSGLQANGIELTGSDAAVTNTGTIRATAHGILVERGGATISNSGTITAGAGFFGIRVNGTGSVTTLVNAQGGSTPLTYSGALPTNYNLVIRSLSSFGRLAVTSPSGSMTFGVDASSALTAKHYRDVLTGVSASAITNEETQFSLGGFALRLQAGSAEDSWDLLAWVEETATEPGTARRTLLGLQSSSGGVLNVLRQRAAATTYALDYDCSVFDQHGLCTSVGLRNSQMGSNYADSGETAGVLTAAYRVTQQLRIGGFIEQGLVTQSPVGVDPKNTQPMLGAFAIFQENANSAGLTIRAALAYQEGDLRITRPDLADTGRARIAAFAFGGEIAYGLPLDGAWVAQPYLGLRHSDSQRQGYAEAEFDSATYPITYNRFGQTVTSAATGLRLRGSITPRFSLIFGAGMEYDLDSKVDRYSGTSTIPGLGAFSIDASQQQNEVRAVGSAGMRYMVASNQALAFDASVRQMPYGNDPAVTTMLRYSIGF